MAAFKLVHKRRTALIVASLLLALSARADAGDASVWDKGDHSAMRLIAGATGHNSEMLRAGIEITLDPGWKTYWRYPGDSGVPPKFDFASSQNVKRVVIGWPAPRRFVDDGETTIGYQGKVILALQVVPIDPARPVLLDLKLEYGVCEKLCLLAENKAELTLPAGESSHEAALAAAEARVPKAAAIGEGSGLSVRKVLREGPRILVDVAAPASDAVDLFAEGPTPDWALPVPKLTSDGPAGVKRFVFALEGLPPGQAAEGMLKLTVIAGDEAIEVRYHLD